jgi:hypothetical protein
LGRSATAKKKKEKKMKSVDWLQPAHDSFSLARNGNGILCLRDLFKNYFYRAPELPVSRGFSS